MVTAIGWEVGSAAFARDCISINEAKAATKGARFMLSMLTRRRRGRMLRCPNPYHRSGR